MEQKIWLFSHNLSLQLVSSLQQWQSSELLHWAIELIIATVLADILDCLWNNRMMSFAGHATLFKNYLGEMFSLVINKQRKLTVQQEEWTQIPWFCDVSYICCKEQDCQYRKTHLNLSCPVKDERYENWFFFSQILCHKNILLFKNSYFKNIPFPSSWNEIFIRDQSGIRLKPDYFCCKVFWQVLEPQQLIKKLLFWSFLMFISYRFGHNKIYV